LRRSFTLVEVLVASLIFFIVVNSIFNIYANSRFLMQRIDDVKRFTLFSSIMFIEQKGKNAYESLIDFNIENDKIIKDLKQYKLNIEKESLGLDDDNESQFGINKIKVYDENFSTFAYEIDI